MVVPQFVHSSVAYAAATSTSSAIPLAPGALALAPSGVPALSSNPGATAKLFIDFDGDSVAFGQTIEPFDLEGNTSVFSTAEVAAMTEIWKRVSEMYSPFNLDVTTVDPGNRSDKVTMQIAVAGTTAGSNGTGGYSPIGGFWSPFGPNSGIVFPGNLGNSIKGTAVAIAHEAGHGFGLQHQAVYSGTTLINEYNPGDASKAPIMGIAYSSDRATWYQGQSSQSYAAIQNDLNIIAGSNNGFGYRADTVGDSIAAATVLGSSLSVTDGLITSSTDADYFRFTTGAGTVSFTADVASVGAMLDLKLELRDANNNVIASANTSSFGETLSANVAAGTYYIVVASAGNYGDIGQYTLSGTAPSGSVTPSVSAGSGYSATEGGTVSLAASVLAGTISSYSWDLDGDGIYGETGAGATRGNETGANVSFNAAGLDGPSTFNVSLRALDTSGVLATAAAAISIANAAPTFSSAAAPANPLYEGSPLTLSFSTYDPGNDTISGWVINWGDGTATSLAGNATSSVKTYADDGNYTVTITATDEDGSYSTTRLINVVNVAPTLTLTSPASVNEGSQTTVTFGATDPGSDTRSAWLINWGDGTTSTFAGSASSATKTYADNGTYTITLTATDEDGSYSTTRSISVLNVAPTITIGTLATAYEGTLFSFPWTVTDPGSDTISSWTIAWGDGTLSTVGGSVRTANKAYADNGTYTITITATDEDGTTNVQRTVSVLNTAPTVTWSPSAHVAQGQLFTTTWTLSDLGTDTVSGWTLDWGDGSAVVNLTAATRTASHTFLTTGTRTLKLTPTDEDGSYLRTATLTVDVDVPVINLTPSATTINEGDTLSLAFASPNRGSTLAGWKIDWGDGTAVVSLAASATSASHRYGDDGAFLVRVTAVEPDTTETSSSVALTVRNVPPVLTVTASADWITVGAAFALSVAGPISSGEPIVGWSVNWGNGTVTSYAASVLSFSTVYKTAGSYTPTVTATDASGGQTVLTSNAVAVYASAVATIATVPTVTSGTSSILVDVTYTSPAGFTAASFTATDLLLSGFPTTTTCKVKSTQSQDGGHTWIVRYELAHKDVWSFEDNATCSVGIRKNEVRDLLERATNTATQTFKVQMIPEDLAGNETTDARQLGEFALGRAKNMTDAIGPFDKNDFYRLKLANAGVFNVKLSGLHSTADLKLFDGAGRELAVSKRGGASIDSLSLSLPRGWIYVRVYDSKGTGSTYSLRCELVAPAASRSPLSVKSPTPTKTTKRVSTTVLGISA